MNILIFSKEAPEWTSKEAKDLRDFLTSETGIKMLTLCALESPSLLDGAHMNKTFVRSGEHKGFENALTFIVGLTNTEPAQKPAPETYPPLDDDSQWEDRTENLSPIPATEPKS